MIYLLDTDHLTALQRYGDANPLLIARLRLVPPDDYGTTIISYEEQMDGRLSHINSAKSPAAVVEAYARLNENLRFFMSLSVWQFTDEAATRFEALRKSKVRIGTKDLRIASIALVNEATVLTRNRRDFEKVPGLLVEDWTI